MSRKVFCAFLVVVAVAVEAADWDYSDGANGPGNWVDNYPDCGGNSQSPISIKSADAVINGSLKLFDRDLYYTPPGSTEITNNGHSLQVNLVTGSAPTINDAGLLPFTAKLAQYHFHWASTTNGNGAEHDIDGATRFGELHLVHYNTKYASLGVAASESDGLAVLGFFLKVGYPQRNEAMDQVFDLISQVPYSGNTSTITSSFSIESILPPEMGTYYRYKGSLTTPGCAESVLWTVFEEDIEISDAQALELAAGLYAGTDSSVDKIVNNNRPVQALNGRTVTKSYGLTQDSAASGIRPSILAGIVTGILSLYL